MTSSFSFMDDVFEGASGLLGGGGSDADEVSTRAAELTAEGQREALDYLKQRERLPTKFREGALTQLAGLYGLPGGAGSQQGLIARAMESPLYKSLMGGMQEGEEAILRSRSATGGLRSGGTISDIGEFVTKLSNEALLKSYQEQLGGLQGLAGLPSNTSAIAQAIQAPYATTAQGMVAGAQAEQQSQQNLMNNLFGLGGAALLAFSDIRLKENIKYVGEKYGHAWFEWEWKPEAKVLGLEGRDEGVMAHFIYETHPDAVHVKDGLLMIDYNALIKEAA